MTEPSCRSCGGSITPGSSYCPSCGAAMTARAGEENAPLAFTPGQAFGRYTIVEEVGAGGMGVVYKALDRELRKTVALKLIPPEIERQAGALERFKRELTLAQQVTHANVCRVYDLGEAGGVHFISMEYVDGQTLRDWIQAVGSLSPRQTVALARQICAGLGAIHEQNIVHRDLKPGNIMVDRSGHALLMDFGLAYHPQSDKITAQGEVLGTLAYLAPEQGRSAEVDRRADVYSLGLILFEMLTGRPAPGDGARLPLALRQAGERCPPPSRFAPEIMPALDDAVLRCLERDPAKRFQTISELEDALARAGEELTASVTMPVALSHKTRFGWQKPLVAASAILAGVLAYLVWPRPPSLSLPPWSYTGPEESAHLAYLFPVVLGEQLRAGGAVRIERKDTAWKLEVALKVDGAKFEADLTVRSRQGRVVDSPSRFQGDVKNMMDSAARMAARIEAALGVKSTRSQEALERYLEGKKFLEGWDVEKNYRRAEEEFGIAVTADDSFAEAHAGLARAFWTHYSATREAGLVDQAMRQAERAVTLGPSLPETHLALGVVQLGRGLSAEGKASFERARELAPADDAVCVRIADVYAALGRDDDAAAMYETAIALRPDYWEHYNRTGVFYWRRSRWVEAEKRFQEVIRLRPDSDTGYSNLAVMYLGVGRFADAERALQQSLAIRPSPEARSNLGNVYYSTGRYEDAAREFTEATVLLPEHQTPWGNLGDAFRQLGRKAQARDAYLKAIALSEARLKVKPVDARTRAFLASCLAGIARCVDARAQAKQATGDAPSSAWVRYLASVAYAVCHDNDAAIEEAVRAAEGGVTVDVRASPDLKPLLDAPRLKAALAGR